MGSLSKIQKQLILGCVLGDGYMRKKTNAHLQITHSIKQKEYVDWKYQILKNLVKGTPKVYKGNAGRVGYRFFTKNLPQITYFYNRFYQNGKKIVPKDIKISPLTLAVWYMDDGSKSRHAGYINCQQFDSVSQKNMLNALNNLNLKVSFNKDKIYTRIYISSLSMPLLVHLIKPFIVPSMRYKLSI